MEHNTGNLFHLPLSTSIKNAAAREIDSFDFYSIYELKYCYNLRTDDLFI